MQTLANFGDGGGPGPWILLFPVIWALVIGGGIVLLRRTVWRGRRGGPWQRPTVESDSPLAAELLVQHGQPAPVLVLVDLAGGEAAAEYREGGAA